MRAFGYASSSGECVEMMNWQESPHQIVDGAQQRELSLRRERRLRLVQHVQPVGPEALLHQRQEGFAV